jgi:hypothetical protein
MPTTTPATHIAASPRPEIDSKSLTPRRLAALLHRQFPSSGGAGERGCPVTSASCRPSTESESAGFRQVGVVAPSRHALVSSSLVDLLRRPSPTPPTSLTSTLLTRLLMSAGRDGDGRLPGPEVDRDHRFDGVASAEIAAVDVKDGVPSTQEAGAPGCVLCAHAFHSCRNCDPGRLGRPEGM